MVPIFPYHIRRSEDGQGAELLLRLGATSSAFIVHLSLEQARLLTVEMRGLATDHCSDHHLTMSVAQAVGMTISSLILRQVGGSRIAGVLTLEGDDGPLGGGSLEVNADVAAALGMAVHLGLPIFIQGDEASICREWEDTKLPGDSQGGTPVPNAFLQAIQHMELPFEQEE